MIDITYVRADKCPDTIVTESTLAEWIAARLRWRMQEGAQGRPDPQLLRAQDLQALEQNAWSRADTARGGGPL